MPMNVALALLVLLSVGCSSGDAAPARAWECAIADGDAAPDELSEIGCQADFAALASIPLDSSIPGARSLKTTIDLSDDDRQHFQNSVTYPIHHAFAEAHLSVPAGLPPVADLTAFNNEMYSSPTRRFLLGAVTHYEGPDVWVYEISPYDTASAAMIQQAFEAIRDNAYFGASLLFHPTSVSVEAVATELPNSVPQITTDELFDGIDYQALNLAESYGQLRFITAAELATDHLSFRDIVVLDRVPNDISVTLGIITNEFQTPLAHINVLSQNRGTPNMALRGAYDNEQLRALDGKWVRLEVGGFDYAIEEVTKAEADAWWEAHKPSQVMVPGANRDITDLRNIVEAVDYADGADGPTILAAIKEGTRAFGGKAANYSAMAHIDGLPTPQAFAVPIHYYFQFMEENGFDTRIDALLADATFLDSAAARDTALQALRDDMMVAPVNAAFEQLLLQKLATDYPAGGRMRFRSSTNAEDLDGFTGAGLYTSKSGDPNDPTAPVLDAIREVWSSVWYFRAFEERSYRSIDHRAVGMALLVHPSFPDEEANGVALTDNPFDKSGQEPAIYVNVQYGDDSVVLPPVGVTTDQFLYYYGQNGQPVTYLSHSNLGTDGATVLTRSQIHTLGDALLTLRSYFLPVYGPTNGATSWWAMDVEFKFDGEPGEEPALFIKQARPFGNR